MVGLDEGTMQKLQEMLKGGDVDAIILWIQVNKELIMIDDK